MRPRRTKRLTIQIQVMNGSTRRTISAGCIRDKVILSEIYQRAKRRIINITYPSNLVVIRSLARLLGIAFALASLAVAGSSTDEAGHPPAERPSQHGEGAWWAHENRS